MFSSDNKLVWCSNVYDFGGYAYMSREYIKGLFNRNLNIRVEPIRGTIDFNNEEKTFFESLQAFDKFGKPQYILEPDVVKVVAFLPLTGIPQFKHNIIYTMMEGQKVNASFVDVCNKFYNTCWTPTKYYAEVFQECGMKIPTEVLPIGIDDMYFNRPIVKENLHLQYRVFGENAPAQPEGHKFISVFRWSFRKGYDLLIKSYLREFKKSDNVSLIIHSRHAAMSNKPEFYEAVEHEISALYQQCGTEDSPPIYWSSNIVPMELMPELYAQGDTFISTSRGEGFCIPALEASRVGLPSILPNHTGFTDYVNKDNCFMFDVDEWVVCNDMPGWNGWITPNFYGQKFPRFGDKAIDEVGSLMRLAINNKNIGVKYNKRMNEVISSNYTWDACLDKAEKLLKAIY